MCEFVEQARANAGKLNYASGGAGSVSPLSAAICSHAGAAQRLAQLGVDAGCSTPAEFADTMRSDITIWAEAVTAENLKIE